MTTPCLRGVQPEIVLLLIIILLVPLIRLLLLLKRQPHWRKFEARVCVFVTWAIKSFKTKLIFLLICRHKSPALKLTRQTCARGVLSNNVWQLQNLNCLMMQNIYLKKVVFKHSSCYANTRLRNRMIFSFPCSYINDPISTNQLGH
jgi:hypothetical protein